MAMFDLGVLEMQLGRPEDARVWYARVIDSSDPDRTPKAMFNLGIIDKEQGNIEDARAWFAKVITTGHSELTPQARGQLDGIRRRQEDLQRAENFAKYAIPNTDAEDEQPRP